VGEVAYAANRGRACAVVAARRCARFGGVLGWRNRNVRLGRLLRVPLVLVEPGAVEPVAEGPSGVPKQRAQAEAVGRDLLDERAA
jgi:hypothetical protein